MLLFLMLCCFCCWCCLCIKDLLKCDWASNWVSNWVTDIGESREALASKKEDDFTQTWRRNHPKIKTTSPKIRRLFHPWPWRQSYQKRNKPHWYLEILIDTTSWGWAEAALNISIYFTFFWVRSSSFFGCNLIHFLAKFIFVFWIRLSSFFG